MRFLRRKLAAALVLAGAALAARSAWAGPFDLEDEDDKKKAEPQAAPADSAHVDITKMPIATIKPHAYSLGECLTLAERNHPLLWAARARLASVHAQLDEAKWTPYS
ncbi:MAG TPA: hypothetical protein VIF62_03360, partial [Labilithrix sp.]